MDEDDIDIVVTLHDELSRPARRVARALDEIGDEAREAAAQVNAMEPAFDRSAKAATQARDELGRFTKTTDDSNVSLGRWNKTVTNARMHIRHLGKETRNSGRSILSFWKNYFTALQMMRALFSSDMTLAIPQLLTGIIALGTSGSAVIASLAMAMAALIPLGAGFIGLAYGMALAGKSLDYIKKTVPGAAQAFKSLGKAFQSDYEAFGRGWGPAARDFSAALADRLANDQIGTALGRSFAGITDAFTDVIESPAFTRFTEAMETTIPDGLEQFGIGLSNVTRALLDVVYAAGPTFKRMGELFNGWSESWAENIEAKVEDGSLQDFFDRALESFLAWGDVLGPMMRGIGNFFSVANEFGMQYLDTWADAMDKFEEWTGSVEGQNSIRDFFEEMQPNVEALGNLFGSVLDAFVQLGTSDTFSTLVNDLADNFVPALADLIEALDEGAGPALVRIGDALSDLMGNETLIAPIVDGLEAIATILEIVVPLFESLPEPVQTAITYFHGLLLMGIPLLGIFKALGGLILGVIANLFGFQTAGGMIGWLVATLRTGLVNALRAVGSWLLRALITPLLAFLASNPIGWIIIAVIALVAAFVILWNKSEAFRNFWINLGHTIVDFWNGTIYPLIISVKDWIVNAWNTIYDKVAGVLSGIGNFFATTWNGIVSFFSGVWNGIISFFSGVWNTIVTIVSGAVNFILGIWNGFVGAIMYVVNIVAPLFISIWNLISAVFNLVWTVIVSAIQIGIALILAWFRFLGNVWATVWNYIKTLVTTVWNWIYGGIIAPIIARIVQGWNLIKMGATIAWNYIKTLIAMVWNWIYNGLIAPTIARIVQGWNLIKTGATIAWNLIKAGVGIAVSYIQARWQGFVSFFRGAWNTAKSIANTAIGAVKDYIAGRVEAIKNIISTIKDKFSSVFNAVKAVVMPIIDGIKSAISTISGMIDNITGGINSVRNTVSGLAGGALETISGWFAEGGYASGGSVIGVGELGPEAFVTNTGQVKMLGLNGPEVGRIPQSGYVVPTDVTAGLTSGDVPRSVLDALRGAQGAAYEHGVSAGAGYDHGGGWVQDVFAPHFDVVVHEANSEMDIERAVRGAIAKADRERRERV